MHNDDDYSAMTATRTSCDTAARRSPRENGASRVEISLSSLRWHSTTSKKTRPPPLWFSPQHRRTERARARARAHTREEWGGRACARVEVVVVVDDGASGGASASKRAVLEWVNKIFMFDYDACARAPSPQTLRWRMRWRRAWRSLTRVVVTTTR